VATTAELQVVIKAQDSATKVLTGLASSVGALNKAFAVIPNTLKGVTAALGSIGLAAAGIQALTGAAQSAGGALGVGLASQMEMVTARFNAFTKDGAVTEKILAQVREEANKTPFAFAEMAQAASMLLPASKTAQGGLMGLIQTSEILAALNPSEGLEGAAFALREALSGDFVSVMERFNIPRELINRLKEEGVPNAEIVGEALKRMGADMSLVGNLANTTQGRLSTFQDAIDGLRLVAGKPILEALGRGLDRLSAALSEGEAPLQRFAQMIGDLLARAVDLGMDAVFALIGAIERAAPVFDALASAALAAVHGDFESAMDGLGAAAAAAADILEDVFGGAIGAVQSAMSDFAPTGERLGELFGTIGDAVSALLGPLGDVAGGLGEAAEEGGALETALDALATVVNAVSAAVEAAVDVGAAFVGWLTESEGGVLALGAALGALTGLLAVQAARWVATTAAMVAARTAASAMAVAQGVLNAVLTANPIGIVVVALAALVGALIAAYQTNEQFRAVVDAAWAAVRATVLQAVAAVQAAIQGLQAWFQSVGGTFAGAAQAVGTAIWQGIVAGIAGGLAAVRNAAVNLATSALASAKAALGVSSPSKAFEEIGQEVGAGFVDGVEDATPGVVDAVEAMAAAAAAAAEGAAGAGVVDALLGGLNAGGQDALANFLRDADRLGDEVAEKSREIGEKAARAARDARDDAAGALEETGERALGQIQELLGRRDLSRATDARKGAFRDRQDEEQQARKDRLEDEELAYRLARDLAKAKTDDDRTEIRQRFEEAKRDLARRRALEADERQFRAQQEQERHHLERTLEDEALQRQIDRIHEDRDERVRSITEALRERLAKITETEGRERAELARSAEQKLNDLKERFFDKVGPLVEESRGHFEALFKSLSEQVGGAAKAVNDLADALNRAAGVRLPNSGGGQTWAGQTQAVRDMFVATHGAANAQAQWEREHAAEIGGGGGGGQASPGFNAQGGKSGDTSGLKEGSSAWWAEENFRKNTGGRALGGPVSAGSPYWVGETGRPELFVPESDGRVFTQSQAAALAGHAGAAAGGDGWGGGAAPVVYLTAHIETVIGDDKRRVAEALAQEIRGALLAHGRRNGAVGLS
jgi:hypothetical protein